jgi:hypothetical protein
MAISEISFNLRFRIGASGWAEKQDREAQTGERFVGLPMLIRIALLPEYEHVLRAIVSPLCRIAIDERPFLAF